MMPIGAGTVVIGIGERTTASMVEKVALSMFGKGAATRVIAVALPSVRAYMHLDTVFTFLDVDKVTAYRPVMDAAAAYSLRPGSVDGTLDVHPEPSFFGAVADALGLASLEVVPTGGDEHEQVREQWGSANNVLAVEPGVVIGYGKNRRTNRAIAARGVEVLEIDGAELGKGRGGARCLTCPVLRDASEALVALDRG
jgi:arginine deiminase